MPAPPRHLTSVALALAATLPVGAGEPVEQAWLDRYEGPAGRTDRGFDVAIDGQGDVVVAGYSQVQVSENLYVPHYLAVKYAPDGSRQWVRTWDAGSATAEALAIDHLDNVILVGSASSGDDFGIVKYDAAGNEVWTDIYPANSGYVTSLDDVAVDATGAIYAVGTYGSGDLHWVAMIKYAPDGTIEWDPHYAGPEVASRAHAIVPDGAGGAYVAGDTLVSASDTDFDFMVLHVDPLGEIDWVRTFGRSGRFAIDTAYDIEVDGSGNVVAAGGYGRSPGNTADVAIVRLAPDGALVSEGTYDGPLQLADGGDRLALDSADNALVVGQTDEPDGTAEVLIVKFDPDGNTVWARRYGGTGFRWDRPYDVAVDHLDNVYTAGEVYPDGTGAYYFTIMYDSGGALQWEMVYGGPLSGLSYAMALAVGADRKVVVTGFSEGSGTRDDVATICYTQPPIGPVGDLDGNGVVNFADLLILLAAWGPCEGECPEDLDGDGTVGFGDVLILLANWS